MVIVQGVFRVEPGDRDAFLAESVPGMVASRADQGCLEYVFAADLVEPGRVVLSERWGSMDDLDAHLAAVGRRRQEAAASGAPPGVTVLSRDVAIYEIASVKHMG